MQENFCFLGKGLRVRTRLYRTTLPQRQRAEEEDEEGSSAASAPASNGGAGGVCAGVQVRLDRYKIFLSKLNEVFPPLFFQLMQKATCDGAVRRECVFDRGDAEVICSLKKEVGKK